MTIIDRLEGELVKAEDQAIHFQRLIRALAPDPREWEFTGEVVDAGPGATAGLNPPTCACGHPIRYIFIICRQRDGSQTQVGSTCIGHFSAVAPELGQELEAAAEKLCQELAEKEKKAREAERQVVVDAARQEFEELRMQVVAAYEDATRYERRAPRPLWEVVVSNKWRVPSRSPGYTRAFDYLRWYKQQSERLRAAMQEGGGGGIGEIGGYPGGAYRVGEGDAM